MFFQKKNSKLTPPFFIAFIVFVVFILVWFLYVHLLGVEHRFQEFHRIFVRPVTISKRNLKFLIWTPFFSSFSYFPKSLSEIGCEYSKCLLTQNRSALSDSDAIIFHWRDINTKDLPLNNTSAKWILFNYEAPPFSPWTTLEPLISRIQIVASYRLDSDIVAPYGFVRRRKASDPDPENVSTSFEEFQLKRDIVWVVSHCKTDSKREELAKLLRENIPVKIYGRCGSRSKCQNIPYEQCYKDIAKKFKFYLAFENSICVDYATEKVFQPLAHGLIPVVLGGANYSRILPPNSYINALDFRTIKDLADYVRKVGSNFTLYKSFHTWRTDYVVAHRDPKSLWLCELCTLVHRNYYSDSTKVKSIFHRWWYDEAMCSEFSAVNGNISIKKLS